MFAIDAGEWGVPRDRGFFAGGDWGMTAQAFDRFVSRLVGQLEPRRHLFREAAVQHGIRPRMGITSGPERELGPDDFVSR